MSDTVLMIGVAVMRGVVDNTLPLEERLAAAMRYVRENRSNVLWRSGDSGQRLDDLMFRTAIGAVMAGASEDEQEQIRRSLATLKALAAASQGIPVDFGAIDMDDLIPLMELWRDSAEAPHDHTKE